MMTWPVKRDFRLRAEALRSAGKINDILHLELADATNEYEFITEIIPQGSKQYSKYLALCENKVKNSKKKYGYY